MSIVKAQAVVRGMLARVDHSSTLVEAMQAPPVGRYISSLMSRELEFYTALAHFKHCLATGGVRFKWNTTVVRSTARMALNFSKKIKIVPTSRGYELSCI